MSSAFKVRNGFIVGSVVGSVCFATACGMAKSKKEQASDSASVGELLPSDSSGGSGSVSLAFGAANTSAAQFTDSFQLAASLDAGSNISLTSAKLSIGAIKIKPSKVLTDSEKTLDEEESKEAESAKKADEAAMDEQKTTKEQIKELAKITDESEKAKKKAEFDSKLAEYKKKRAEAAKAAEEEQLEQSSKKDKNLRWKGPYVYDLVSKSISPALSAVSIPDGSYERIELKLKPLRGTDTTEPLLNNSIYIKGSVVISGTSRTFEVFLHQSEEIKLYGNSKVKVDANGSASIAINFDPQTWFSGVDFSNATLNSDGTLTIDRDNNAAIYKAIRKNFKKSVMFGKNVRGDGRISSSEAAGDSKTDATEKEAKEASGK